MNSGELQAWHFKSRQPVTIKWNDGVIRSVEAAKTAPDNIWIAPPLLDLQVNGYNGVDFQQDNLPLEDLLRAARELRGVGCTSFLLTLITDDWSALLKRLAHLRALRAKSQELQDSIAGWHIEGPFLSAEPGFRGAHPAERMRHPTPELMRELRQIIGADPVLLTIAPERDDAIASIETAVALGIRVSLGHTNAAMKRVQQAIRAGAIAFTHLGNGCPQQLDRHDNILWRIFETDELYVGLIPDRIHVSIPLFRIAHRLISGDRIFYVSDAMAAAGAPPGQYQLGKLLLEVGEDEVVRLPGTENFAGSALRPIDGVLRAAEMLRCPWQEIWQRYSVTPAQVMGLTNDLQPGRPATFCVLEAFSEPINMFYQLKVFVRGQLVHEEEL